MRHPLWSQLNERLLLFFFFFLFRFDVHLSVQIKWEILLSCLFVCFRRKDFEEKKQHSYKFTTCENGHNYLCMIVDSEKGANLLQNSSKKQHKPHKINHFTWTKTCKVDLFFLCSLVFSPTLALILSGFSTPWANCKPSRKKRKREKEGEKKKVVSSW